MRPTVCSDKAGSPSGAASPLITKSGPYAGLWPNVGQLTLGAQKVFYQRTVITPGMASASDSNTPWLYSAAAAAFQLPPNAYCPQALVVTTIEKSWATADSRREPRQRN